MTAIQILSTAAAVIASLTAGWAMMRLKATLLRRSYHM